jgi:hypothetical protein
MWDGVENAAMFGEKRIGFRSFFDGSWFTAVGPDEQFAL